MIVRIRGVEYPSGAAAARALGVSRHCVWKALERGYEDDIGMKRHARNRRPVEDWTDAEIARVTTMRADGKTFVQVAAALGRPEIAVISVYARQLKACPQMVPILP